MHDEQRDNQGPSMAPALRRLGSSIRVPIQQVAAAADAVLGTALDDGQRSLVERIERATGTLADIVSNVVDLAEIESGAIQLLDVPFTLPEVVLEVVRTMRPRASDRGLELRSAGLDQLPRRISGDPGRLRQVLTHLVGNAIEHTPSGRIYVGARMEAHHGDRVTLHFAVRDTGIGIPDQYQRVVFEPFVRLNESLGSLPPAAGLGLTISAHLVERMGGRLALSSELGIGSTFHFTASFGKAEGVPGPAPDYEGVPWVVVLGEPDSPAVRLAAGLDAFGISATAFASLAMAVQTLGLSDGDRPDVVVVAFRGRPFEQARRVVEDSVFASSRVAVLVEAGERGDAAACRRLGLDAYLPNPVNAVDLAETVMALASGAVDPGDIVTRHWLREHRTPIEVLVVDSTAPGRAAALRALRMLGHECQVAPDATSALELAQRIRFGAVIVDVAIPDVDPAALAKSVKNLARPHQVAALALVPPAEVTERGVWIEEGFDGVVDGPCRPESVYLELIGVEKRRRNAVDEAIGGSSVPSR